MPKKDDIGAKIDLRVEREKDRERERARKRVNVCM